MTARDRRALIVGAAVLALAWLAAKGLPTAIRTEQALRERVTLNAHRLAQLKHDLARLQALEDSAGKLNHQLIGLAPRLLGGKTPNDAAVELSALLRRKVESVHARLMRIAVAPDSTPRGTLRHIVARVEIEGDAVELEGLLADFATSDPVLVAEVVQVAGPAIGTSSPEIERLRASIEVWAWWLPLSRPSADGSPPGV